MIAALFGAACAGDHGIAALILGKDVEALAEIADRCVVIAKGQIVYRGTPAAPATDRDVMIRHLGV